MAEPVYSTTVPVPPAVPIPTDNSQNNVFCSNTVSEFPIHLNLEGLGTLLQEALGRQDMLYFTGPNTDGERAQRSVGGGVAIAADNRLPRLGDAEFGANHVNDALIGAMQVI